MLVNRLMSATSTSARNAAPSAMTTARAETRRSRRSAGPRASGGVVKADGCSPVIGAGLQEEGGLSRAADGGHHRFESGAEGAALGGGQGGDRPHEVGLDGVGGAAKEGASFGGELDRPPAPVGGIG